MNPADNIKPEVRGLRAYSLRPDRARVKLNQNENPWDVPPEIMNETLRRIGAHKLSRYPDFSPLSLQKQLARFSGWLPEGIIAGNGSNELIQASLMVTVDANTPVLISEPTFALYRQIVTVLGGEVISAPLTSELNYDVEAIRKTIKERQPRLTIICSPNNPTGCVIDRTDLISLLELSSGLVVIDEAYHEFSGESAVPLLESHSNLIVLRTFSKAMAMAGLRVGYLLAAPELTKETRKAVLPYNLNLISQVAAEVAIEMYDSVLKPRVEEICRERERVYSKLGLIEGLSPVPSRANFIAVRSAIEPRRVYEELLDKGILIRDISGYPMMRDYFRVSVGTADENDELIAALTEIFSA